MTFAQKKNRVLFTKLNFSRGRRSVLLGPLLDLGRRGIYSPGRDSEKQRFRAASGPSPGLPPTPPLCSFSSPSGSAARPELPCPPHGYCLCPAGSHSSCSGQGNAVCCQEPRTLRLQRCINGLRCNHSASPSLESFNSPCPHHPVVQCSGLNGDTPGHNKFRKSISNKGPG